VYSDALEMFKGGYEGFTVRDPEYRHSFLFLFLQVDVDISSKAVLEPQATSLSSSRGHKESALLSPAAKRLAQEQTQVYERLSHLRNERLVALFDQFKVARAKKKKVALVEALCE